MESKIKHEAEQRSSRSNYKNSWGFQAVKLPKKFDRKPFSTLLFYIKAWKQLERESMLASKQPVSLSAYYSQW